MAKAQIKRKSRPEEMMDAALSMGGIEVRKDNWKDAEEAVKLSEGKLRMSSARGPGNEWKRLGVVNDE